MTSQKTVLVTGANSGIGLATVLELAKRDDLHVIGTVRSQAKAKIVAEAAADAQVPVATELLDVTDAAACAKVIAKVGPLHGLVNNAGYGMTGAIEDVEDDEARQILETMVLGPTRLARLALPAMRANGGGRIINISSIYGKVTTPLTGWYQASKHAIEGISDALRMEVSKDNIDVILIEPGGFKTNIWEDLERDLAKREGSDYAEAYGRVRTVQGLWANLMGDPASCAKVIDKALSASSPRTRYLVGADAHLLNAVNNVTPTIVMDRVMRFAQKL